MKAETPELAGLLAREQAIRRETEILRDANIALTQNLSLERVLETLLDFLARLVPYDSANVMFVMKSRSLLSVLFVVTKVFRTLRQLVLLLLTTVIHCCGESVLPSRVSSFLTRAKSRIGSWSTALTTCAIGWVFRSSSLAQ